MVKITPNLIIIKNKLNKNSILTPYLRKEDKIDNIKYIPEKKDLLLDIIPPLDIKSLASQFFGVDSAKNIEQKIYQHAALAYVKEATRNITTSLNLKTNLILDSKDTINQYKTIFNKVGIPIIKEKGATRINLISNKFGALNIHTIGIVYDKKSNYVYVLDSFGKNTEYRKQLEEVFNSNMFSKVILNNKKQQTQNTYTCNNWTFANIEAVKNKLNEGKIIDNSHELDSILPKDINKILSEQKESILNNLDKIPRHIRENI